MEKKKKKGTIGLAMGACGFRISFHAGFIDGLKKIGVEIDQIAGTSTGSLSASLACLGIPGKEWLIGNWAFWHLPSFKYHLLEKLINEKVTDYLKKKDKEEKFLKDINGKLRIIAAELPNLGFTTFNKYKNIDDFTKKLTASCALPYWTNFPVEIGDKSYIDGSFSTLFPSEFPQKALDTDFKISLRVVPPYSENRDPDFREYSPKIYKYNLIQAFIPYKWIADRLYKDGFNQAVNSNLDKIFYE